MLVKIATDPIPVPSEACPNLPKPSEAGSAELSIITRSNGFRARASSSKRLQLPSGKTMRNYRV